MKICIKCIILVKIFKKQDKWGQNMKKKILVKIFKINIVILVKIFKKNSLLWSKYLKN